MNENIISALEKNTYLSLNKTLETLDRTQGFSWFIFFQEELNPSFKDFYIKGILKNIDVDKTSSLKLHWNIKYLIYPYFKTKDLETIKKYLKDKSFLNLKIKINKFINFKTYLTLNEFESFVKELKDVFRLADLKLFWYEENIIEQEPQIEPNTQENNEAFVFLTEKQEEPEKIFKKFWDLCLNYSERIEYMFKNITDFKERESFMKKLNLTFYEIKELYEKLWMYKYKNHIFTGTLLQPDQYYRSIGASWGSYSHFCNSCFKKSLLKDSDLLDEEGLYCKECSKKKIKEILKKSKFKQISNNQLINYLVWVSKFSFNKFVYLFLEEDNQNKQFKIDLFKLNELIFEEAVKRNLIFKDKKGIKEFYFVFSKDFKINDSSVNAGATRLNRYPLSYANAVSIEPFLEKMKISSSFFKNNYSYNSCFNTLLTDVKQINLEVVPFKLYGDFKNCFSLNEKENKDCLNNLTYDILRFWKYKNEIPTPPFGQNNIEKIVKDLYKIDKNLPIFI